MKGLVLIALLAVVPAFSLSAPLQQGADPWGTVKGRLVWDGDKIPVPGHLADPNIPPGVKVPDDRLIVNAKNRGIRNGLVWLEWEEGKGNTVHPNLRLLNAPEVAVTIKGFRYHPPVTALRAGQPLVVKNADQVPYPLRCMSLEARNETGLLLPAGQAYKIAGLAAQRYPLILGSDVHPWMRGYVGVFDHPYFAVTDEDGRFEIKLAPAGPVRVFIWQQKMGWLGGKDGRDGYRHTVPASGIIDLGDLKMKK
jgi:hypothetical protein